MCRKLFNTAIIFFVGFWVLVLIGASLPKRESVSPASAPTSTPGARLLAASAAPAITVIAPTLDTTGQAIVATQAWFVQQQTQAVASATPLPEAWEGYGAALEYVHTHYAQGSVNVRACPRRDCALVGTLVDGQRVVSSQMINGEPVADGNKVWYQLDTGGYVYSAYVTDQEPATAAPTSAPYVAPTEMDSPYGCNGVDDLNCEHFPLRSQAQAHLAACGNEDRLDGDDDGLACEDPN